MFNKNYNAYLNFLFLYKAILMAFPNVDINRSSSSTQIHCSSEAWRPIPTSGSYAYKAGWSLDDPWRIPWVARPYLHWNLVCVGAIATRLKQDDSWLFHWVKINSIWAPVAGNLIALMATTLPRLFSWHLMRSWEDFQIK